MHCSKLLLPVGNPHVHPCQGRKNAEGKRAFRLRFSSQGELVSGWESGHEAGIKEQLGVGWSRRVIKQGDR